MRIYFFSSRPAALKIDGELCGYTDGFRRRLDLSPQDCPLVEWLPLDGRLPLVFPLGESLLFQPPRGVKVCLIPEGVALYADKFPPADTALSLLLRVETGRGEAMVYRQGETQALWQGRLFSLPDFTAPTLTDGGDVLLLQEEGRLCALSESGVFYRGSAENIRLAEGKLTLEAPLRDLRGRTAVYEWDCSPAPVLRRVTPSGGKTLPAAYFLGCLMEALSLGEDISPFVCADLAADAAALKDYFGGYVAVRPTGENAAGGIYRRREGVYEMRCFRAEITDGKISNVTRTY